MSISADTTEYSDLGGS